MKQSESVTGWGWGGCTTYCEHGGICMLSKPHVVHDTGTHPFMENGEAEHLNQSLEEADAGKLTVLYEDDLRTIMRRGETPQ